MDSSIHPFIHSFAFGSPDGVAEPIAYHSVKFGSALRTALAEEDADRAHGLGWIVRPKHLIALHCIGLIRIGTGKPSLAVDPSVTACSSLAPTTSNERMNPSHRQEEYPRPRYPQGRPHSDHCQG